MADVAILDAWTLVSSSTASPGSLTVSAGTNRVLLYKHILRSGTPEEVLTVTYGGQAMQQVAFNETNAAGNDVTAALWMLGDAGIQAATDANFAITRETANGVRYRASAAVYQNVQQADPVKDAFGVIGTGGTDPVAEALDVVDGGFVIATMSGADHVGGTTDVTWTSPLTEQLENAPDASHYESIAHAAQSADGTFTPAFSLVNDGNTVMLGLSLRAETRIDIATETDTAQAITARRIYPVIQALETDTAQEIIGNKGIGAGLTTETDLAQGITPRKLVAVGQATESDSAQEHLLLNRPVAALLQAWATISTSAVVAASGVGHVISAGTDRLFAIAIGEESTLHEPTAVAYGGEAMTLVAFDQAPGSFSTSASLWVLDEAGIQAAADTNVVVTFDGSHDGQFRMFAATYDNVDQADPIVDSFNDDAENANPDPAVLDTSGRASAVALLVNDGAGVDVTWSGVGVAEVLEEVATVSYHSIAAAFTHGLQLTMTPTAGGLGRVCLVAMSLRGKSVTTTIGLASEIDEAFAILDSLPPVKLLDAWTLVSSSTLDPGQRDVSAAANRLLVYKAAIRDGAGQTVTAVSFGGQPMELVTTAVSNGDGAEIHSSWWVLDEAGIQAAVGNEWEITRSTADGVVYRAHSASYHGVDQTDPIVDAFSAIGNSGVDPTSEAIDTVAGGVVVAALSGADQVGGTQDVTWSNLTEQAESASAALYESIARQLVVGDPFTPSFTLVNDTNSILSAISLRAGGSGVDVGNAAELDEAFEITHVRIRSMGLSSETDAAQEIRAARLLNVGQAGEVDSALNIIARKGRNVAVGQATETDAAQSVTVLQPGRVQVGLASETDSAQEVRAARGVAVGQATETDSAQSIGHAKGVQVGLATETDTAQIIIIEGQAEEEAARRRKDGGGGQSQAKELQAKQRDQARRMGQLRRQLDAEDEELMEIIPAIAAVLVRSGFGG